MRLQRLSRGMTFLTALVGALAVAVFGAYWLAPGVDARLARDYLADGGAAIAQAGLLAALAVSVLLLGAALWGVWHAFQLFRAFGREAQPASAGRHVRQMGLALAAMPLITVIGAAAVSLLLTLDRTPGSRELTVSVGLPDLVIGLTGLVLVAIGFALTDAAAIADENRQFV